MKLSNKKIIVSTLALAMGAALAGSISGSIAWYQYSTRASAQVQGLSAGTTGDLAIKIDSGSFAHKAVTTTVYKYMPMSASVDAAGEVDNYYGHPVYQNEYLPLLDLNNLPVLGTNEVYYHDYELTFKFMESTNTTPADATAPAGTAVEDKEVFLTYFAIEGAFANAVRVEMIPDSSIVDKKFLLSANAAGETTTTTGNLDLNNNGANDTDFWDVSDVETTAAVAGDALAAGATFVDGTQYYTRESNSDGEGYLNDGTYKYTPAVMGDGVATADEGDKYFPLTNQGVSGGTLIDYINGTSVDPSDEYDTMAHSLVLASDTSDAYDIQGQQLGITDASTVLKLRVWIEGWALINGSPSWDLDTLGQSFNINMQFACNANK